MSFVHLLLDAGRRLASRHLPNLLYWARSYEKLLNMRSCEKLWEVVRSCEKFWEVVRSFEKLWEVMRSFEKFWEVVRSFEKFREVLRSKFREVVKHHLFKTSSQTHLICTCTINWAIVLIIFVDHCDCLARGFWIFIKFLMSTKTKPSFL